jgi:hypothetical protein
MRKRTLQLTLLALIAAFQSHAAEEPSKSAKGSNKIERTVEKTGAAMGRTADRVEKSVKKGAARTADAIDSAGKKTGQWLNEKTK